MVHPVWGQGRGYPEPKAESAAELSAAPAQVANLESMSAKFQAMADLLECALEELVVLAPELDSGLCRVLLREVAAHLVAALALVRERQRSMAK